MKSKSKATDKKSPCNCTLVCKQAGRHVPLLQMKKKDREQWCGIARAFGDGPHTYCTRRCRDAGRHVPHKRLLELDERDFRRRLRWVFNLAHQMAAGEYHPNEIPVMQQVVRKTERETFLRLRGKSHAK